MRHTIFVGITGSVGKTLTNDLSAAVLSQIAPAWSSHHGLNLLHDQFNMVMGIPWKTRFAVFEIAISEPGAIDPSIQLVRPSIAAMTIIGRDHIKAFGSKEAIAEEKAKLIAALPKTGTAVLNRDDPLIRAVAEKTRARILWFGSAEGADLRLIEARSNYPDPLTLTLSYQGKEYRCRTALYGTHLVVPALTALGIGLAAGLSLEEAIAGIAHAQTTPGRMQIVPEPDGVTFVRDDYKAPHWTLQVTLDFLKAARAERKVAIIGTLSDYSLSASKLYPKVARRLREVADLIVFVGPHALRALKARTDAEDHQLQGFTDIRDAHRFLQSELRAGDLVYLKGTNRVDHLVRLVLARQGPVTCWVSDCGRGSFCDRCSLFHRKTEDTEHPSSELKLNQAETSEDTRSDAWLILGLGNPDQALSGTPHNIGASILERLARQLNHAWSETPEGQLVQTHLDDQEVMLFKPGERMNRSGPVVEALRQRLQIHRQKVIVIHDDTDLPLAEVRLKLNGSDGGHKGLRSLFSALGNDGFMPRIRVGVRSPKRTSNEHARAIVLEQFSTEDAPYLELAQESAITLIKQIIVTSTTRDPTKRAHEEVQPCAS
ncbi:MAG: aminoacyl-tRNA hydrolase [Gammaproteobacteria bacterium]|jgi:aminoacyl-tRNA hydrolase|nr:aminoacyl-tRNA hydrolase [Gammaproteobacteria bacterium]